MTLEEMKKKFTKLKSTEVQYSKEDGYWYWRVDRDYNVWDYYDGSKKKPTLKQIGDIICEALYSQWEEALVELEDANDKIYLWLGNE